MSIEAMKMALKFCEDIGDLSGPYPYLNGTGVVSDSRKVATALRQAIEQAEKQEPFIYVREDNEKPFGGYEHCSEADAGAFPVYTAPVDAVNMKQERVDETAKDRHEPAVWGCKFNRGSRLDTFYTRAAAERYVEGSLRRGADVSLVGLYTASPKREWVGLDEKEVAWLWFHMGNREKINGYDFAKAIEAKLKERNT